MPAVQIQNDADSDPDKQDEGRKQHAAKKQRDMPALCNCRARDAEGLDEHVDEIIEHSHHETEFLITIIARACRMMKE